MIGNLDKVTPLDDLAVLFAKVVLSKPTTKATFPILDKYETEKSRWGAVRAGKQFILPVSNEDMDEIMKMVESLENLGLLTDSPIKTWNKKISRSISYWYDGTYGCYIDSIYGFFIDKFYNWKKSHESWKRVGKVEFFHFLALPLLTKVVEGRVKRVGRGYYKEDHMDNNFLSWSIL